jgi:hypothetical protein
LKCLWTPSASAGFLACFDALLVAYLRDIEWEPSSELETRIAALLPALLLARIDGKSPVEYIEDETIKKGVRTFARPLIATPASSLSLIKVKWAEALPRILDKI